MKAIVIVDKNWAIGREGGLLVHLPGDLKYHDFQQAESNIILADIGHFESEQFVKDLIYWEISKKCRMERI